VIGVLPANGARNRFVQAAAAVLSGNLTGWAEKRWLEAAGAASVSAVPPESKLASLAPPAAGWHNSSKSPELDVQEVPMNIRADGAAWAEELMAAFEGADWGPSVGADASSQTTRDSVSNSRKRKRTRDDIGVSMSTKNAIMRALARFRFCASAP